MQLREQAKIKERRGFFATEAEYKSAQERHQAVRELAARRTELRSPRAKVRLPEPNRRKFVSSIGFASFIAAVSTASAPTKLLAANVPNVVTTVPTIGLMRVMIMPTQSRTVRVLGYYAPGDGGEGEFTLTNVNPGADDGGYIIASNTSGWWFVRQIAGAFGLPSKWFGTKGDGATPDQDALNNALAAAISLGTFMALEEGTFVVQTTKSKVILGATRSYALNFNSFTHIVGIPGRSIIKLADGQSTDLSPRDTNIFVTDAPTTDVYIDGVIFDLNESANPISPNRNVSFTGTIVGTAITVSGVSGGAVAIGAVVRGVGVAANTTIVSGAGSSWVVNISQSVGPVAMTSSKYNHYCCGSINITGDSAFIDRLTLHRCQFINNAGTNQIVTGQCTNGFAGPMGSNIRIYDCKFQNNGTDTNDHSTMYIWSEDAWVYDNYGLQNLSLLSTTDRNWVFVELHGARNWLFNNVVRGFFRLCWIASNFTRAADSIRVESNTCEVWGEGPSYFRQVLATYTPITKSFVLNNSILLLPDGTTGGVKSGIACVTDYSVTDAFWRGNRVAVSGTGYDSVGLNISVSVAGQVTKGIHAQNNHINGTNTGLNARLNSGTGVLDEIHDWDNVYYNLGKTDTTVTSIGSRFQADDVTVFFGKVSSLRNRYVADGGTDYDWGQFFLGSFDECYSDSNVYDGQVNFTGPYSITQSGATITRSLGRQLCTYNKVPTTGTWRNGEIAYNYNTTQAKNIPYWQYSTADGHFYAHGNGFGTTAQRPGLGTGINDLNAGDAGYSYYNTSLAKSTTWGGSAWL